MTAGTMSWFGRSWGSPMCQECDHVAPPVGEVCAHCGEVFFAADSGVVFTDGKKMHRNCFLRGIFGSVAHIEGTCSCFVPGSAAGDPPGLSTRESANEAARALGFRDEDLICDFCNSRDPLVRDVLAKGMIFGQFQNGAPVIDSGVWGACEECAKLIDANDWNALLDRSVAGSLALNPSRIGSEDAIRAANRKLFALVFGVKLAA